MAKVRLWINNRDNAIYDLPRVCTKCGAPSTTVKMRQFAWYPPWIVVFILVGFLPFAILAMIMTKRQRVELPFCDQHKSHFGMRVLIALGGLFALLALGVLAFIAAMALSGPRNGPNGSDLGGVVCGLWFVALFVYAVALVVFNMMTTIRPTSITERDITLTNVAPEFVRAVEAEEDELERDTFRDRDRPREKRRPAPRDDEDRIQRPDRAPRRPTDARDDD